MDRLPTMCSNSLKRKGLFTKEQVMQYICGESFSLSDLSGIGEKGLKSIEDWLGVKSSFSTPKHRSIERAKELLVKNGYEVKKLDK